MEEDRFIFQLHCRHGEDYDDDDNGDDEGDVDSGDCVDPDDFYYVFSLIVSMVIMTQPLLMMILTLTIMILQAS